MKNQEAMFFQVIHGGEQGRREHLLAGAQARLQTERVLVVRGRSCIFRARRRETFERVKNVQRLLDAAQSHRASDDVC